MKIGKNRKLVFGLALVLVFAVGGLALPGSAYRACFSGCAPGIGLPMGCANCAAAVTPPEQVICQGAFSHGPIVPEYQGAFPYGPIVPQFGNGGL